MTEYDMAIEALQSTPDFDSTVLQSKSSIPLYYQYRSFGSFWSIIKSESFWATDARFSNDSEEQRFGANIMHHLLGGESGTFPELNEDYIVCFCGEDDKLSQWRGYAAEGGVSIGFDFNAAVPFYVMLKDKEFRADLPKEAYRTVFAQLGHVCYLPPDLPYDLPAEQLPELPPDLPVEQQEDQRYRIFCANEIGCPNDIQKGDSKAVEAFLQELRKRAPFIKHTGFQEENEYRLIFRNEDGQLSECVRYHPVDGNGIQRPYILVRPGNPAYDRKRCVVRLCLKDTGLFHKLWGKLNAELNKSTKLVNCRQHLNGTVKKGYTDRACFGCIRRCWINGTSVSSLCCYDQSKAKGYNWGTHDAENSVIISQGLQQEKIFEKVYAIVKEVAPTVSVWCEGHLPIRCITIGPCTYQQEVAENIRHYCRHVYWLRDVEIKVSKIPYRRSI